MKINKKLGELEATAICGNDISSSCLYVSAISIGYAGQYAWIALLLVAVVLFLYRKIYGEVVGALPLNGGAYNVLLNAASKDSASVAACLTILSYMATGVLSATEAMHYLADLIHAIPVYAATIVLLAFFLVITLFGITESAKVALVIFVTHLFALSLLVFLMTWYLITNGFQNLFANFSLPMHGSLPAALFFGFSAAMLGISGFESSANFVEEQAHGVFPKTLRNMWAVVSFFNPVIAFLAIAVIPVASVNEHKETLLSHLGNVSGGRWLGYVISVDAVLVLSGATLTSFVGVSGLLKRMALDRIWPQFFLRETRYKSNYVILTAFFLLCLSVLSLTRGKLEELAGVYTISFLSVMGYFAIGNLLFKLKRSRLPRPENASRLMVFIALFAVACALYGNVKLHPEYLVIFLQYFVPAMLIIYGMLKRNLIAKILLDYLSTYSDRDTRISKFIRMMIRKELNKHSSQKFVFFSKADDISVLNKVMIYVSENEVTKNIKIVTILPEAKEIPQSFMQDFEALDRAYPEIKMDYITLHGQFTPAFVESLSRQWNIPKNFMFIGSPGDHFPYRIAELGGVRLII